MSDNIFINHLNHIHGNFLTDLHVKITLMNNFAGPATPRHEECYSKNMELGVLECNLTKWQNDADLLVVKAIKPGCW